MNHQLIERLENIESQLAAVKKGISVIQETNSVALKVNLADTIRREWDSKVELAAHSGSTPSWDGNVKTFTFFYKARYVIAGETYQFNDGGDILTYASLRTQRMKEHELLNLKIVNAVEEAQKKLQP